MNKNKFNQAIKYQHNEVRVVNGKTIANVRWHSKPWKIVKDGTTFEQASSREYEVIAEFERSVDLYKAIN